MDNLLSEVRNLARLFEAFLTVAIAIVLAAVPLVLLSREWHKRKFL